MTVDELNKFDMILFILVRFRLGNQFGFGLGFSIWLLCLSLLYKILMMKGRRSFFALNIQERSMNEDRGAKLVCFKICVKKTRIIKVAELKS